MDTAQEVGSPTATLLALSREQRTIARRHVLEALAAGLHAIDPRVLLSNHVRLQGSKLLINSRSFELSRYDRVLVIGGGKAAALMTSKLETILSDWITDGVVSIPTYTNPIPRTIHVRFHKATHPIPSVEGVRGMQEMLAMVGRPTQQDLVICLLSGGGSALMPLPVDGVAISDKKQVSKLLLKSGATIDEINAVRKHLSAIKGGRLAQLLYPAQTIALIISDVFSGRLDSVASGPLTADETTFSEAKSVLHRYGLWNKIPDDARRVLQRGARGLVPETPKKGSPIFRHVTTFLLGGAQDACVSASKVLHRMNYDALVISTRVHGEARHVGTVIGSILLSRPIPRFGFQRPFALIAAGETIVKPIGAGRGGRNQELVLSAALALRGTDRVAVGSIDTDGMDGSTPAAGALADGETIEHSLRRNVSPESYLQRNDSYSFFKGTDGQIVVGPTGTNVGDLIVGIAR